jgi:hypothetical protein
LWIFASGTLLEVITLFELVPKDSSIPPARFQELLAHTQWLWTGLVAMTNHLTGLPQLLFVGLAFAVTVTGFVAESAIIGLPICLAIEIWRMRGPPRPTTC